MADTDDSKLSPDYVKFHLLKMKLEEGANLVGHYLRGFAFFLAINGVQEEGRPSTPGG